MFFHLILVWRRAVSQPSSAVVPLGLDMHGIVLLYDGLYTWHVFTHTECCCRAATTAAALLLLCVLL